MEPPQPKRNRKPSLREALSFGIKMLSRLDEWALPGTRKKGRRPMAREKTWPQLARERRLEVQEGLRLVAQLRVKKRRLLLCLTKAPDPQDDPSGFWHENYKIWHDRAQQIIKLDEDETGPPVHLAQWRRVGGKITGEGGVETEIDGYRMACGFITNTPKQGRWAGISNVEKVTCQRCIMTGYYRWASQRGG